MNPIIEEYKMYLENLERSPRTVNGYLGEVEFFRKWMEVEKNGPITLKDIEPDDVSGFLFYLREERNYKPASRRRIAATLRGFFTWAYKRGYVAMALAEAVPVIRVNDTERSFLSVEQINQWVEAVEHDVSKVAMWLMYFAGLRISEATNLKLDDLHLDEAGSWIMIRKAKGGKFRRIPIAPALETILKDYLTWRVDSEYLLATEKTGRIKPVTIQAELREARNKLGWSEDITPHTLRHSFASQVYSRTQDILVVSKLLGHSSLKTTQVYAHLHDDRMVEAIQAM